MYVHIQIQTTIKVRPPERAEPQMAETNLYTYTPLCGFVSIPVHCFERYCSSNYFSLSSQGVAGSDVYMYLVILHEADFAAHAKASDVNTLARGLVHNIEDTAVTRICNAICSAVISNPEPAQRRL